MKKQSEVVPAPSLHLHTTLSEQLHKLLFSNHGHVVGLGVVLLGRPWTFTDDQVVRILVARILKE